MYSPTKKKQKIFRGFPDAQYTKTRAHGGK